MGSLHEVALLREDQEGPPNQIYICQRRKNKNPNWTSDPPPEAVPTHPRAQQEKAPVRTWWCAVCRTVANRCRFSH